MTAINGVVAPSAAYLYSDGASFDYASGAMKCIYAKQLLLPHLPAALAIAGQIQIGKVITNELGRWQPDYDAFKAWMRSEFRWWYEPIEQNAFVPLFPDPAHRKFTIVVAGWSAATGPDAFTVGNDEAQGEPFELYKSKLIMQPGVADMADGFDPSRFDPHGDGIKMMEKQRALMRFKSGGEIYCGIGGFIQHTTIKRDSISSWIPKR